MSTITRRSALTAGAAALAGGTSNLAAIATSPDPIFAAIEKHRRAMASFNGACQPGIDIPDHLGDEQFNALSELLSTTPTTAAGCEAVLRYVGRLPIDEAAMFDDDDCLFCGWAEAVSGPGMSFLERVANTLTEIAASPGPVSS